MKTHTLITCSNARSQNIHGERSPTKYMYEWQSQLLYGFQSVKFQHFPFDCYGTVNSN